MNHEIRTELNGILGLSALLENAAPDVETLDFARTIGQCGRRLLNLLAPILDPSAYHRGGGFPASESRHFREVFSEVVDVLGSAGYSFARRAPLVVSDDVPALPAATAGLVRLVLYDLLCETSGCEEIQVSLQDGGMLRLTVRHDLVAGGAETHRHAEIVARRAVGFRRARAIVSACGGEFRALHVDTDSVAFRINMPIGHCVFGSDVSRSIA
jgi:hypothetical protein